jgi:hypothetical protein
MKWVRHAVHTVGMKYAYKIVVKKRGGNHFGDVGIDGNIM